MLNKPWNEPDESPCLHCAMRTLHWFFLNSWGLLCLGLEHLSLGLERLSSGSVRSWVSFDVKVPPGSFLLGHLAICFNEPPKAEACGNSLN